MTEYNVKFGKAIVKEIQGVERERGVRIGLVYKDAASGAFIHHRANELFHAASTMKVPVMIEIFRRADAGELSMTDLVSVDPVFESMLDGSPYEADARKILSEKIGGKVSVMVLAEQMIVVSDNLATNLLITMATPQRITKTMRALGANDGYVVRCLMDIPAYDAGFSNRISAADLTILMEAIDKGKAASAESCGEMKRILLAQEYNDLIPAELPKDVRVAHKTGSITAINHDTAIVYAPDGAYYLTVLTDGFAESEEAAKAVAGFSRKIHEHRQGAWSRH